MESKLAVNDTEGGRRDHELRNYSHPYAPYPIQIQLMDAIYDTIQDNYKVGIFESPTGTGKTLSIICSSMTWLRHYKKNTVFTTKTKEPDLESESCSSDDDEPEWVKQAYEKSVMSKTKGKAQEYEEYLLKLEKSYDKELKQAHVSDLSVEDELKRKRQRVKRDDGDESYLPEDYYSDSEITSTATSSLANSNNKLTAEIQALLNKVDGSREESIELVNQCPVSIFYSSRTHSQLTQFSHQLNLTHFESSFENIAEKIKFLLLGSRKQLCIHPTVSKISNITQLNDACIDLQKKKGEDKTKCCNFIPKLNDSSSQEMVKKFTDFNFTKIHDIEDLGTLGKLLKICPYYSVREAVQLSEIIALPYQMLLNESTREIMNLNIENSIVIIDEAHNLLDVISSMNSVSITLDDCNNILKSLKFYLNKFIKKLNAGNRINLMKLIKLCQIIQAYFQKNLGILKPGSEVKINDLFQGNTGDLLNVHKLEKFLTKSKIAYKLERYLEKLNREENKENALMDSKNRMRAISSSNPLLFKIIQFLKKINNPSKEGKFFWNTSDKNVSINYMLLDPSEVFRDLVLKARCVLLCGGTMEPMSDYENYLFPYIHKDQIKKFSCGHIIPENNLRVFPIGGFETTKFEFLFDKRNNQHMIKHLGELMIKLFMKVPDGVVIFFPSYNYLNLVLQHWRKFGVYDKLKGIKQIYQEPTESTQVDKTLSEYSYNIKNKQRGSALFSVVGGKMSEGINFSDELARAVVMIGLPYPNAFSGEIVAKQKYIEDSTMARGGTSTQAKLNSRAFYDNICMRAVNQSIGRSIRHGNDYSIIYLIDVRYQNPRIQSKLSGWVNSKIRIKNRLYPVDEVLKETQEFFTNKLVNRTK